MNEGPIAGGATLAAGSGTADGVGHGPRSTEHAWSCQKPSCPSIQGHGSCVAANGGRAAAWAVDEAQALRAAGLMTTRARTSEQEVEVEGGKALAARGRGNLVWVPRCTRVPGHFPGMHALRSSRRCSAVPYLGSLIPRLPLLSLDFGTANSNFGPHPYTPDLCLPCLVLPVTLGCPPILSCTLSSRLFGASVCPLCLPTSALSCFPAVAEHWRSPVASR